MKPLSFLEYYKQQEDSHLVHIYEQVVSARFDPKHITALFNEFEESYDRYPWRFWHKDKSLAICIEAPNNFCEQANYLYLSVNNEDSMCMGKMERLDDFISYLNREKVPFTFKDKIAKLF
jgi:hypothetical protein